MQKWGLSKKYVIATTSPQTGRGNPVDEWYNEKNQEIATSLRSSQ